MDFEIKLVQAQKVYEKDYVKLLSELNNPEIFPIL